MINSNIIKQNEELNFVYNLNKYEINEKDLNSKINLKDDFNLYVNSKWKKNNPIPDKHISWGSFQVLNEETKKKLKILVENEYNGNNLENINILYRSGMNEDKINKDDLKPLEKYLNKLKNIKTKKDLFKYLSELYKLGLTGIFAMGPSEDAKNSVLNVPHLYGGGLGLPDRDYYFDDDKEDIRLKYFEYIKNLLKLLNYKENIAMKITKDILEIETKIANVTYTREERRNPEIRYNKMTLDQLIKKAPHIEWKIFFDGLTDIKITYLIVDNPKYFNTLSNMFKDISLETWKNFFIYKMVKSSASFISERFVDHNFSFYNKELSGQIKKKPRWERILSICNGCIGELIGKLYVKNYFPETSKKEMFDLVNKIMKVLKDRIEKSSWMSDKTKEEALLKHKALITKIGYPDKWEDYSQLKLFKKNSFFENIILCSKFEFEKEIKKLYKESDPNEWGMDPQEINAYFHPLKNEIVFPAGILQFPFFSEDMHYAYNYGAIGAVIGHELTHCFDDQGSKYDHNGNLRDWWSGDSRNEFDKKTKYF